jgi:hypothetical protein
MRVSRGTIAVRFGALAAAAAIAVSGGAVAANAATAAPAAKLPTALSIQASAPVVRHHVTYARIKGQLTSSGVGLKFKVVWLAKQGPKGNWHLVRRDRTNRRGWARFLVHTRRTANYALVYRGQPNFQKAHSAVVTITVPAPSS